MFQGLVFGSQYAVFSSERVLIENKPPSGSTPNPFAVFYFRPSFKNAGTLPLMITTIMKMMISNTV